MPSFLKQRPRIALAVLGVAAALLVALASVTLLGGDADDTVTATPSTTMVDRPDESDESAEDGDDSAGSGLGGGATTTTTATAGEGPDTGSEAVTDDPGAEPEPLSGSIVLSGTPVPEGPPEEGEPEPTPISEAAALACARVEFAVDAWDSDDPGAYQSHLAEAIALAADATEPAIGAEVPALEEARSAEDPAPGITRFLEACLAIGYAI